MRTRRGTTSYWPGSLAGHIAAFQAGDIVTSTIVEHGDFFGIVRDVQPKINKVMVAWGGGSLVQHDPEEIQLSLHQTEVVKQRMASRRPVVAMDGDEAKANPQYVGDPKVNGLDTPRGGGFSIMQNLAKDQAKESLEQASGNPKVSDIQASELKSRRAMYWCGPDRTYRLTRSEQASGSKNCPKCCSAMETQPYTKRAKLLVCEDCGFKISSDKVLKEKPVEAIPVEPQVTVASLKSRRTAN